MAPRERDVMWDRHPSSWVGRGIPRSSAALQQLGFPAGEAAAAGGLGLPRLHAAGR